MQMAVREDREWECFKELAMKLLNVMKRFGRDDRGMETVEWAIMAAILVAGLVGVIGGIGTNVLGKFTSLQTATH
jgi:Flp pilus assembly pilin Flp